MVFRQVVLVKKGFNTDQIRSTEKNIFLEGRQHVWRRLDFGIVPAVVGRLPKKLVRELWGPVPT